MILVLGGTTEGRQLAQLLHAEGCRVLLSTVTPMGAELAPASLEKRCGALNEKGLVKLIADRHIKMVVDATHPFAVSASHNAMAACHKTAGKYLRLERPPTQLPESESIYPVDNFGAAAKLAFWLGRRILLTIGSRHLTPFLRAARKYGGEVVLRVLPQTVAYCRSLGILEQNIIAFQGVDSVAQNRSQFEQYDIQVMVCKDSGEAGGTPQKIDAAIGINLPVVVIKRPYLSYPRQVSSIEQVLEMISTAK